MDRAIEWSDGRVVRMEVAVDITDSVKASEELLKSQQEIGELLQEKELVLKEAHHRIKNNMAMVQGMLSLQADSSKEPGAASLLEDAAGRMQSMMLLYDKLYRAEHHGELALDAFLAPLIEQGIQNYPLKVQVDAQVDIASDVVEAKVLSSLGILVNELVTNSLKHAFTGHAHGRIEVTCARDSDVLNLHYRDNGTGIPEGVLHNGSDHFGLQLLHLLAEQLGGSLEYAADEGACYHLTVPL